MILLTGATGLLGSHLLCYLLQKEKGPLRACRRSSSSLQDFQKVFAYYFGQLPAAEQQNLQQRIEWVDADISDLPALEMAFEGISHVYHTAALVSFEGKDAERLVEVNVRGTANMVNLALELGIKKFCYCSSIAAIGRPEQGQHIDEKTSWVDSPYNTQYAISKYRAEMEVWRAAEEGLDVVILNPGVIIGAGSWAKSSGRLFKVAASGFPFYTHGSTGFVDVRDVAAAMWQCMNSSVTKQRFVLVGKNAGFKEFFELAAHYSGKRAPRFYAPYWLTELAWMLDGLRTTLLGASPIVSRESARSLHNRFYYDSSKITREQGFVFTDFDKTMKDTAVFLAQDMMKK